MPPSEISQAEGQGLGATQGVDENLNHVGKRLALALHVAAKSFESEYGSYVAWFAHPVSTSLANLLHAGLPGVDVAALSGNPGAFRRGPRLGQQLREQHSGLLGR